MNGNKKNKYSMFQGTYGKIESSKALNNELSKKRIVKPLDNYISYYPQLSWINWLRYNPSDPEPSYWGNYTECFVAGTKIIMKDGPDKNIEDVKIGDEVLSYNVHSKQFEPNKVTNFFTQTHNLKDGDITVKITYDDDTVTHNTIANPFWSKDKGFVAVDADRCNEIHEWVKQTNHGKDTEKLEIGDTLFVYNNDGKVNEVVVTDIEPILEPNIRTYDIEVEDNHTFFANGILTHNSSASPPGPGGCTSCTAGGCGACYNSTFTSCSCSYSSQCPGT